MFNAEGKISEQGFKPFTLRLHCALGKKRSLEGKNILFQ